MRRRPGRGTVARVSILCAAAILAGGWGLFALGARASPRAMSQPPSPQIHVGQRLYQERCASCHGPDATGTIQGPPILGLGPAYYDFMMSTGRMPAQQSFDCPNCSAAEFATRMQNPRRRPVLSRSQIDAVTAYLVQLSGAGKLGEPIPHVDLRTGSASLGFSLYQRNCAPCHGWSGIGGAVGPQDAPSLHHATPVQVAEAVRIGPGTMPRFGEAEFDQEQLNSLTRYVLYLRHPNDRGGASLSHVGPLIEGFVALGLGLGLIMVATRYIGTRS